MCLEFHSLLLEMFINGHHPKQQQKPIHCIIQRHEPDPLARVMQREEIESLFQIGLEPRDLIIFIRISQGFTQAEIADELDLTEAAVSMRVRRTRRRIAEHRRTHDTDAATF